MYVGRYERLQNKIRNIEEKRVKRKERILAGKGREGEGD